MARTAEMRKVQARPTDRAVDTVQAIFEHSLSKLPPKERARRWSALEAFVKKHAPAASLAKR